MRISLAIPALCLLAGQLNMQAQKSQPSSPAANYGNLPLSFEANQGQIDPHVQFLARGQGYSLFLTDSTAVLALTKAPAPTKNSGNPHHSSAATEKDVVRMEVVGASTGLHVAGAKQLPGIANYYIGNDPAKWHSNIPTYAQVKYSGVYPGIDLVYYGDHGQLEYDFIVAPGADPKPMELRFSRGQKLHLNANGDLTIKAHSGQIAFHKPFVYQTRNGKREEVEGRFTLMAKNAVGFQLGAYDHDRELVIDPTLAYSTYLGGSGVISTFYYNYGDYARTMTVDGDGNAYVAGDTLSQNFPVTGNAFQKQNYPGSATYVGDFTPIGDSFISKLNAAGSALIYSTYFGGSGDPGPDLLYTTLDAVNSIAIDGYGNAYVTGQASSPNFPTTPGAFQTVNGYPNAARAFVTKLSTTGPLVYSTLLGGSTYDSSGLGIAVDSLGNAYVAGYTGAGDFPTTPGAFQPAPKSPPARTGFVTKLNATGTALIYSTLLGGSDGDFPISISVDKSGDAFVAGLAGSSDFPTTPGAYETTYNPYSTFSFVTKLNPDGSGLIYSTFFPMNFNESEGGSGSLAVDGSGNVYTIANAGPVTSGAFQTSGHGWVGKLNASGTALVYGTYVGGRPSVGPPGDLTAIAVDQQGHAFVAGYSYGGFPVTADAFQENYKGVARGEIPTNAVLAEVNADGTALLYGTYLGGSGVSLPHRSGPNDLNGDVSFALAVDSTGNVYMAGSTISNDFPVTSGAFQTTNPAAAISTQNAFISKFAFHGATTTTLTSNANPEDAAAELNFTATVAPVDGTGVPTGIVNFLIDGQTQAKITLDGSGTAVYSTTTLPVGSHSVVASYYGAPRLYSSSNAALTETIVGQVATPTFAAVGGTYPPAHASPVVIQTSTPGATIYYTTNGTMPSTTSAVYSAPIPITATTTYKAIAVESGDTSSGVATATFAIVANAIKTTTSLVSSVNPSLLDEAVTFTATVSAVSGPVPAGTVTFKHGAVVMGTVPLVGGVAHISTSDLELLGHTISAIYTGSATDAWSGQELIQNVTQ